MSRLATFRDLYRHLDWSGQRVLDAASTLTPAQLAKPFEMGPGSLGKTLWHVYDSERTWLERVSNMPAAPDESGGPSIDSIHGLREQVRAVRGSLLARLTERGLGEEHHYRDRRGNPHVSELGDILLHVVNHAMYHHAQAVNMLRHNGVAKPPRLDYLFMYHENKDWPAPALSVGLLRTYFAYTDWARARVFDVAQPLDDASLDRPFEMGIGSIRKNLAHAHGAEAWWLTNWTAPGSGAPFPKTDQTIPIADLRALTDQTAARRNEFLAAATDADLLRDVEGTAAPRRVIKFPLGVTMMQLCHHGTHHRAQTVNMLRHCGQTVPPTDYIVWTREK